MLSSLLVLLSTMEVCAATLLYAGHHSLSSFIFLLCTLSLFAAAVMSARQPSGRARVGAQSAAAAALLALFWAAGTGGDAGPSITLGHTTYQLTLTLAALLFLAMLLARLLRGKPAEQACRCG